MKKIIYLSALLATLPLAGCDDGHSVETSFVPLAFLNSIEVECVSLVEEQKGDTKVLVRIPCSVLVGFDLADAEYETTSGGLCVTLPEPTVNSPKVHSDKVEILGEEHEWRIIGSASGLPPILKEQAERKAQQEISKLAESPEVVRRAKNEARRLITCFYRQTIPGRRVKIVWKSKKG